MAIIVDTSAVLAIFDESYGEHLPIAKVIEETAEPLVLSPMVVAEADYMLLTRLGQRAARQFAREVTTEAYELAEWTACDHATALTVIDRYGGARELRRSR